jgi:hypothetical protein
MIIAILHPSASHWASCLLSAQPHPTIYCPDVAGHAAPKPFLSLMTSRVVNITNGHRYKFNQAKRLVEDQCVCVWVDLGVSVRELDVDEMVKARSKQTRLRELTQTILGSNESPGLRFERPKTTNFRFPREAYEEMDSPLGVRYCRWPRHEFSGSASA